MYTPVSKIPDLELFTHGSGKYEIRNLEGPIVISCWSGFQSRQDADAFLPEIEPSDGHASINIGGDMVSEDPQVLDYHLNAYNYLMEHQVRIQENILHALLAGYGNLKELYGFTDEEAATLLPAINDVNDLKKLIGLSGVYLLNVSKDNVGYVGYEFGCTWDDERGLGIMTHMDRVIEIGDGSTAFLTWVADRDLNPDDDSYDTILRAIEEESAVIVPKKPWWKFW